MWKDGAKVLDLGIIDNINTKSFGPWLPPAQAITECEVREDGIYACESQWDHGVDAEGGYQLRVYDASDTDGNPSEGFSGTFKWI